MRRAMLSGSEKEITNAILLYKMQRSFTLASLHVFTLNQVYEENKNEKSEHG